MTKEFPNMRDAGNSSLALRGNKQVVNANIFLSLDRTTFPSQQH